MCSSGGEWELPGGGRVATNTGRAHRKSKALLRVPLADCDCWVCLREEHLSWASSSLFSDVTHTLLRSWHCVLTACLLNTPPLPRQSHSLCVQGHSRLWCLSSALAVLRVLIHTASSLRQGWLQTHHVAEATSELWIFLPQTSNC